MRYSILITITILIAQIGATQSIEGVILDNETGEPLIFANVALYKDSILVTGTTTSLEGEYSFEGINPGTYDLEADYVGYFHERVSEVIVKEGIMKVDIRMEASADLQDVVILPIHPKIIDETLPKANQGIIQGKVFDEEMNEGLPFVNVILLQEGIQKAGTTTDIDGSYIFVIAEPAEYDVEAVYVGYFNTRITGISVENNPISLDILMARDEEKMPIQGLDGYTPPIFNWETTSTTGATWKANEIKRFPGF